LSFGYAFKFLCGWLITVIRPAYFLLSFSGVVRVLCRCRCCPDMFVLPTLSFFILCMPPFFFSWSLLGTVSCPFLPRSSCVPATSFFRDMLSFSHGFIFNRISDGTFRPFPSFFPSRLCSQPPHQDYRCVSVLSFGSGVSVPSVPYFSR